MQVKETRGSENAVNVSYVREKIEMWFFLSVLNTRSKKKKKEKLKTLIFSQIQVNVGQRHMKQLHCKINRCKSIFNSTQ